MIQSFPILSRSDEPIINHYEPLYIMIIIMNHYYYEPIKHYWLVVWIPLKNISQWEEWHPIYYGK